MIRLPPFHRPYSGLHLSYQSDLVAASRASVDEASKAGFKLPVRELLDLWQFPRARRLPVSVEAVSGASSCGRIKSILENGDDQWADLFGCELPQNSLSAYTIESFDNNNLQHDELCTIEPPLLVEFSARLIASMLGSDVGRPQVTPVTQERKQRVPLLEEAERRICWAPVWERARSRAHSPLASLEDEPIPFVPIETPIMEWSFLRPEMKPGLRKHTVPQLAGAFQSHFSELLVEQELRSNMGLERDWAAETDFTLLCCAEDTGVELRPIDAGVLFVDNVTTGPRYHLRRFAVENSVWKLVRPSADAARASVAAALKRDFEYIDPTLKPLNVPSLPYSATSLSEKVVSSSSILPQHAIIDVNFIKIGLPGLDRLFSEQKFTQHDYRPRWPLKASHSTKPTPLAPVRHVTVEHPVSSLKRRVRVIDCFEEDFETDIPEPTNEEMELLADELWMLWAQSDEVLFHSQDLLFVNRRSRLGAATKKLTYYDIERILEGEAERAVIQPRNDAALASTQKNCIVLVENLSDCDSVYKGLFSSANFSTLFVVVATLERKAQVQELCRSMNVAVVNPGDPRTEGMSAAHVVVFSDLNSVTTSSELSFIMDASCCRHISFRSTSWTPEEAACRQWLSRQSPALVRRVILLSEQPPTAVAVLTAICDAFKLEDFLCSITSVPSNDQQPTFVVDVPEATRSAIKNLIQAQPSQVSVQDDNLVDYVIESLPSAKQKYAAVVSSGKLEELKDASKDWTISSVCHALCFGGKEAGHMATETLQRKFKKLPGPFFERIRQTVASSATEADSLIGCLFHVLQSACQGFLEVPANVRILVLCPSSTEEQFVVDALRRAKFPADIVVSADPKTSVSNFDVIISLETPNERSESHAIQVSLRYASNSTAQQMREIEARRKWIKILPPGVNSIPMQLVLQKLKLQGSQVPPRWTKPLRLFVNSRKLASSNRLQKMCKALKASVKIDLIEKNIATEEDFVVDHRTCIFVCPVSQIHSDGIAYKGPDALPTLFDKYSKIFVLIVSDGLKRLRNTENLIKSQVSAILRARPEESNAECQIEILPCLLPSDDDLLPAVVHACERVAPSDAAQFDSWLNRDWIAGNSLPGETLLSGCRLLNPFFVQLILQKQPSVSALKNMQSQSRRKLLSFLPTHLMRALEGHLGVGTK